VDIRLDGVDWWWTKEIIQLWRPTLGLSLPSTALVIKADRNRQFHLIDVEMADMDVFAAMGIAGFGKATSKKKLDPARFDKNKRDQVCD